MTPLFAPDIFSRPNPVFKPASSDITQEISEILAEHYGFDLKDITLVEKLEGLEINSQNFKIGVAGKFYALKRVGAQVKPDVCRTQLSVTQTLYGRGIALPHLIESHEGLPYVQKDNAQFWVLSDFIEGSYFTGAVIHYSSSIDTVVALQTALENFEQAQALPLSAATSTWDKTASIIKTLFARIDEWPILFPAAEAQILLRGVDHLKVCFEMTCAYEAISEKNIVPTHIDLHPHNILMKNDFSPVIVDIDSLQRADKTQSLAFAVFKLTRQHIVQEKIADLAAPAQFFMKALGIKENAREVFFMAAMAEVLRRIGIIADLNMHKANRDWNAVLHLQLAALRELPYVFGREK